MAPKRKSVKSKSASSSATKSGPPTTVVSTRVNGDIRKSLTALCKKSKHKNISETLLRVIEHYFACDNKLARAVATNG